MVGYAGSPTYTAYVDVTLTRFKVKVKVTGLLNFQQLAKPCMLAAMTAAPLRGFLVEFPSSKAVTRVQTSPSVHLSIFHEIQTAIFRYFVLLQSHGWVLRMLI